jgi:hypothetical protein
MKKKSTRFTPLARDTRAYRIFFTLFNSSLLLIVSLMPLLLLTPIEGTPRTIENFERHLEDLGYDSTLAVEGAYDRHESERDRERSRSRGRSGTPVRERSESQGPMKKRSREEYQRSLTPKPGMNQ